MFTFYMLNMLKIFITTGFLDFVHRPEFYKRTMDKVQKPSSNECYTPSSESFRIYVKNIYTVYTGSVQQILPYF
jgi:hypothetical protein